MLSYISLLISPLVVTLFGLLVLYDLIKFLLSE